MPAHTGGDQKKKCSTCGQTARLEAMRCTVCGHEFKQSFIKGGLMTEEKPQPSTAGVPPPKQEQARSQDEMLPAFWINTWFASQCDSVKKIREQFRCRRLEEQPGFQAPDSFASFAGFMSNGLPSSKIIQKVFTEHSPGEGEFLISFSKFFTERFFSEKFNSQGPFWILTSKNIYIRYGYRQIHSSGGPNYDVFELAKIRETTVKRNDTKKCLDVSIELNDGTNKYFTLDYNSYNVSIPISFFNAVITCVKTENAWEDVEEKIMERRSHQVLSPSEQMSNLPSKYVFRPIRGILLGVSLTIFFTIIRLPDIRLARMRGHQPDFGLLLLALLLAVGFFSITRRK